MRYYSETLKQLFDTEEECKKAESEALEAKKKAEEERTKLLAERKVRAQEIEDARKIMQEAQNKYNKLLREFLRDYKTYHYSTNSIDDIPRIMDWFGFFQKVIFKLWLPRSNAGEPFVNLLQTGEFYGEKRPNSCFFWT